MATEYTHDFEIEFENQTISGEIEFNVDGKMGYKTTNPVEWNNLGEAVIFPSSLQGIQRA